LTSDAQFVGEISASFTCERSLSVSSALDAKRGQMIRVWLQRLYELTFSPSAEFLKKQASFLRFSLSRERQLGIHLKSALGWLAGWAAISLYSRCSAQ